MYNHIQAALNQQIVAVVTQAQFMCILPYAAIGVVHAGLNIG